MAVLEIYADLGCPFTHVGLTWVAERRRLSGRTDLEVRVRSWPLELVNGRPLDPTLVADHVAELRDQVAPELFAGFDPQTFPRTTLRALALTEAVTARGPEVGLACNLALRRALFEEGTDISDPAFLERTARFDGLTLDDAEGDAVVQRWHEGQARGVRGSPHFFCGPNDIFCPSLDLERDDQGHLQIHRSIDLLESFLTTCVGLEPGP